MARLPLQTQYDVQSWTTAVAGGAWALEPEVGHIFLPDLPDQLSWYRRTSATDIVNHIMRTDKQVAFCLLNEFTTCSIGKGDLVFMSAGRSFLLGLTCAAQAMLRLHLPPVTAPPGGLPRMVQPSGSRRRGAEYSMAAGAQTQIACDELAIGAAATLPSDHAGGVVVQRAVPLLLTQEHRSLIEALAPITAASGCLTIFVVVS